jgi:DNA polymerase gamma 1
MNLIPSDVQYFGTLTGRTSGFVTTLPSPSAKKPNKIGACVKHFIHAAPPGYKAVGFDFSALELVIAAALDSKEYCERNGLPLDPFAREIGNLVFKGSSANGTDIHTVVAAQVGIPRKTSKVLEYSSLYGSGLAGLEAVARPELPSYSSEELSRMAKDFMAYFKGIKIRGTPYYSGGLFSHFFNYAYNLISEPVPRLPFLKTAITTALRPEAVGKDYLPGRINWVCQGSAGELHDTVLVLVQRAAITAGLDFRFYVSVHDEIWWLVADKHVERFAAMIKQAHAEAWEMFFKALGFEGAPPEVKDNVVVNVDSIVRKEVTEFVPKHIDYAGLPPEARPKDGYEL